MIRKRLQYRIDDALELAELMADAERLLDDRKLLVFCYIASGETIRETARELGCSIGSVQKALRQIRKKLGLDERQTGGNK